MSNVSSGHISSDNILLWHYTTLNTFEKIVREKTFKLFDPLKSNDPLEGEFYWKGYMEAYENMYHRQVLDKNQYFKFNRVYNEIQSSLRSYGRWKNVYLCGSFSECSDSIPMWRSYGDNGKGISIGFYSVVLDEFARKEKMQLGAIEYKTKKQVDIEATQFWTNHIGCNDSQLKDDLRKRNFQGYFAKEKSNEFEHEYRLLFEGPDLCNHTILPTEKINSNIDAMTSGDRLVFYYALKLEQIEALTGQSPIGDICIGPQCNIGLTELKLFLHRHNITCFNVCKSEVYMR